MKYQITLTEKQARLLSYALDQFPRLIEGQDSSFQDLMESAWEKRCKKATGNMMDDEWDGGWNAMREDAERICKEIKKRFWGLKWNANYGIRYNDEADILYDMHCVLRHALWLSQPEPKNHMTVDSNPAHQFGSEPLATITLKDE